MESQAENAADLWPTNELAELSDGGGAAGGVFP